MFHVIVLGGIALVGCGGTVSLVNGEDGSVDGATDAFPHEGKVISDAFPTDTPPAEGFPSELPAMIDATVDGFPSETDMADVRTDSFPSEGPIMGDSATDAGSPSDAGPKDGFPM